MKYLFILVISTIIASLAHGQDATLQEKTVEPQGESVLPLTCPHCGTWQISNASRYASVGESIVIDTKRVIIPDCGMFTYEPIVYSTSLRPDGETKYRYNLSLSLKVESDGILCKVNAGQDLRMNMIIEGISQEGGTAEIQVQYENPKKEIFSAFMWNMTREPPESRGASDFSELAALYIAVARLENTLAKESQTIFNKKNTRDNLGKKAGFNAGRFSIDVHNFCENRERESGAGLYYQIWVTSCRTARLEIKLKTIMDWQVCMSKSGGKVAYCRFPDERFDKSPAEK